MNHVVHIIVYVQYTVCMQMLNKEYSNAWTMETVCSQNEHMMIY